MKQRARENGGLPRAHDHLRGEPGNGDGIRQVEISARTAHGDYRDGQTTCHRAAIKAHTVEERLQDLQEGSKEPVD
jgi:hypothetical protein